MDTLSGGSQLSTIPAFNKQELYSHIQLSQGWKTSNGLPYSIYRVEPVKRLELLPQEFIDTCLQKRKTAPVFSFRIEKSATNKISVDEAGQVMKKAVESEPAPLTQLEIPEKGLITTKSWCSEEGDDNTQCHMPDPDTAEKGTMIAIYNSEPEKKLHLKKKSTLWTVDPREGAIFILDNKTPDQKHWVKAATYRHWMQNHCSVNPLITDKPYVAKKQKSAAPLPEGGEYFLPSHVVQDLITVQRDEAHSLPCCSSHDELCHLFESLQDDTPVSFLIEHEDMHHVVAARVIRDSQTKQLICYINETLDYWEVAPEDLRHMVFHAMHTASDSHSLDARWQPLCLTNSFSSQKDLCSCTTMAYDTIQAFDKNPELDQWLKSQAAGTSSSMSEHCYAKPTPGVHSIPLQHIPPVLLKSYQGNRDKISPEQMESSLSKKRVIMRGKSRLLKLADHYEHNSRTYTNSDGKKSKPNLYSTARRYKLARRWCQLPVSARTHREPKPKKRPPSQQNIVFPFRVLSAADAHTANVWLREKYGKEAQVNHHDYKMACEFEALINQSPDFDATECQALLAWLKPLAVQKKSYSVQEQLKQAWCQLPMDSSDRPGRTLQEAVQELQYFIDHGTFKYPQKPAPQQPQDVLFPTDDMNEIYLQETDGTVKKVHIKRPHASDEISSPSKRPNLKIEFDVENSILPSITSPQQQDSTARVEDNKDKTPETPNKCCMEISQPDDDAKTSFPNSRQKHNIIEQRRRAVINGHIAELYELLPQGTKPERYTKGGSLTAAVSYKKKLEADKDRLTRGILPPDKIQILEERNRIMALRIQELESALRDALGYVP